MVCDCQNGVNQMRRTFNISHLHLRDFYALLPSPALPGSSSLERSVVLFRILCWIKPEFDAFWSRENSDAGRLWQSGPPRGQRHPVQGCPTGDGKFLVQIGCEQFAHLLMSNRSAPEYACIVVSI
jgi:hypothetical protein